MRTVDRLCPLSLAVLVALSACAGEPPPPQAPVHEKATPASTPLKEPEPSVQQEVGALNQQDVDRTFSSLMRQIERCQDDRRASNDKLDFVSGEIHIEVRVRPDGSAKSVFLPSSTLGDQVLEQCVIRAAKEMSWPRPVGGEGIAKTQFQLPMKADRDAVAWDASKIEKQITKAKHEFAKCKARKRNSYQITAYVDRDGSVLAAGASQPTETAGAVVDCLVKTTKGLKLPSPGGWPAKVTFSVD